MTPERARKLAQACADSWYGGASGLSLKEVITQGILEACQETEGDLVATRAERNAYRQDLAAARAERDAYSDAISRMNAPAIALAALQPPPPIIMPAHDWDLHQQIQTLNERIAYLEPIFIAARNLVDNAEEWECDGLGLFAQHGWWEPLHDALDPDGSAAADDIRQPVTSAK